MIAVDMATSCMSGNPHLPRRLRSAEAGVSGRSSTCRPSRARSGQGPHPRRPPKVMGTLTPWQPAEEQDAFGALTLGMRMFNKDIEKSLSRLESSPEASLLSALSTQGLHQLSANLMEAAEHFQALPPPPLTDTVAPEALADHDSRFAQINADVRLHYKFSKNSNPVAGAPAVVLMHGFQGCTFSWRGMLNNPCAPEDPDPLGRSLNAALGPAAVVAYDRPPYGLSSRPTAWEGGADANPYGPRQGARQALQLLDYLGLGDTVLVAHSAGAPLAMEAARKHPDRVKGLVLVAPAVFVDSPLAGATLSTYLNLMYTRVMLNIPGVNLNFVRSRIRKQLRKAIEEGSGNFMDFYDKTLLGEDMVHGYTKQALAHGWDVASLIQYQSMDFEKPDLLEDLDIPILIVQGSHDRTVPAAAARKLHAALGPKAEYLEMERCGHHPMDELPQELAEAINPFIQRVLKGARSTAAEARAAGEAAAVKPLLVKPVMSRSPPAPLAGKEEGRGASDRRTQPSARR